MLYIVCISLYFLFYFYFYYISMILWNLHVKYGKICKLNFLTHPLRNHAKIKQKTAISPTELQAHKTHTLSDNLIRFPLYSWLIGTNHKQKYFMVFLWLFIYHDFPCLKIFIFLKWQLCVICCCFSLILCELNVWI